MNEDDLLFHHFNFIIDTGEDVSSSFVTFLAYSSTVLAYSGQNTIPLLCTSNCVYFLIVFVIILLKNAEKHICHIIGLSFLGLLSGSEIRIGNPFLIGKHLFFIRNPFLIGKPAQVHFRKPDTSCLW